MKWSPFFNSLSELGWAIEVPHFNAFPSSRLGLWSLFFKSSQDGHVKNEQFFSLFSAVYQNFIAKKEEGILSAN